MRSREYLLCFPQALCYENCARGEKTKRARATVKGGKSTQRKMEKNWEKLDWRNTALAEKLTFKALQSVLDDYLVGWVVVDHQNARR
jgi:hypothetical protein